MGDFKIFFIKYKRCCPRVLLWETASFCLALSEGIGLLNSLEVFRTAAKSLYGYGVFGSGILDDLFQKLIQSFTFLGP